MLIHRRVLVSLSSGLTARSNCYYSDVYLWETGHSFGTRRVFVDCTKNVCPITGRQTIASRAVANPCGLSSKSWHSVSLAGRRASLRMALRRGANCYERQSVSHEKSQHTGILFVLCGGILLHCGGSARAYLST